MYVNCYNENGFCLFAVTAETEKQANTLGDHIYLEHDLIDFWSVSDMPQGAVVKY